MTVFDRLGIKMTVKEIEKHPIEVRGRLALSNLRQIIAHVMYKLDRSYREIHSSMSSSGVDVFILLSDTNQDMVRLVTNSNNMTVWLDADNKELLAPLNEAIADLMVHVDDYRQKMMIDVLSGNVANKYVKP